jgi:hypothetical protein
MVESAASRGLSTFRTLGLVDTVTPYLSAMTSVACHN